MSCFLWYSVFMAEGLKTVCFPCQIFLYEFFSLFHCCALLPTQTEDLLFSCSPVHFIPLTYLCPESFYLPFSWYYTPPRPASRSGSKKGRTTPLYLEGLKFAHLGLSLIYLYNCRKLLRFRGREKRMVNAKKRGLRPEKSGGSPAITDFTAVCCLDIYGKTVFRILLQKARKPAWILRKKGWHLFCQPFMVPVAGLEPARCRHRWILSPLRLPIPSHRHVTVKIIQQKRWKSNCFFHNFF